MATNREFNLYCLTNLNNGKQYVGITTQSVLCRWRKHCSRARGSSRTVIHLAIRKHGEDAFLVETIAQSKTWDDLKKAEQLVIRERGTMGKGGYNCTLGGDGVRSFRHTPETKRRIAATSRGRLHSDDAKMALSKIRKQFFEDPNYKTECNSRLLKWVTSDVGRRKISERMKEEYNNDKFKPFRDSNIGKKRTKETRTLQSLKRHKFYENGGPERKQRKNGITVEMAADIKALAALDVYSQSAIGRRYGVRQSLVWSIKNGKVWKDVEAADATEALSRYLDASWQPMRVATSVHYGSVTEALS